MAHAIVYGVHTLEMNALRGLGVAFLASVATSTHTSVTAFSPAAALTVSWTCRNAGKCPGPPGRPSADQCGADRLGLLCRSLGALRNLVFPAPCFESLSTLRPSRRARQVPPILGPAGRHPRGTLDAWLHRRVHRPWVGSSMRAGACRPRLGPLDLSGSHPSRSSRWRYSCSCDLASSQEIEPNLSYKGKEQCRRWHIGNSQRDTRLRSSKNSSPSAIPSISLGGVSVVHWGATWAALQIAVQIPSRAPVLHLLPSSPARAAPQPGVRVSAQQKAALSSLSLSAPRRPQSHSIRSKSRPSHGPRAFTRSVGMTITPLYVRPRQMSAWSGKHQFNPLRARAFANKYYEPRTDWHARVK